MDHIYRRDSGQLAPDRRATVRPDGTPAPTGYYPDRSGPQQGQATFSPVYDQLYGPARQEMLDAAELRDQHPYLQISGTWTPPPAGPRRDGRTDPQTDGPGQPTLRLLTMFRQRAQGTSDTHLMNAPGIRYPTNGSQDGASWTYYQDPALAMADFAPAADSVDGQMPDSLRALPPSPAHGWTEQPVFNAKELDNLKFRQLRQQQGPHQDRLANSTYAGQSYSATTSHVSQAAATATTPTRRHRG